MGGRISGGVSSVGASVWVRGIDGVSVTGLVVGWLKSEVDKQSGKWRG